MLLVVVISYGLKSHSKLSRGAKALRSWAKNAFPDHLEVAKRGSYSFSSDVFFVSGSFVKGLGCW